MRKMICADIYRCKYIPRKILFNGGGGGGGKVQSLLTLIVHSLIHLCYIVGISLSSCHRASIDKVLLMTGVALQQYANWC